MMITVIIELMLLARPVIRAAGKLIMFVMAGLLILARFIHLQIHTGEFFAISLVFGLALAAIILYDTILFMLSRSAGYDIYLNK